MQKAVTYNLSDNFISKLASFIEDNFLKDGRDLSRIAIVFGGRRPHLFLSRELAAKDHKGLLAPVSFSIDEFVEYVLSKKEEVFSKISDLDAAYLIYELAASFAPAVLKGRREFSEFMPWAKEILSFIEQLDLENIDSPSLNNIQQNASIGYDVPENINMMLRHIVKLREEFHKRLIKSKTYTRGLIYRSAAQGIESIGLEEFDCVLFCNIFYLHGAEESIIKSCLKKDKATVFFQGDARDWSVLDRVSKALDLQIQVPQAKSIARNVSIYRGFDTHSQVCMAREIVKNSGSPTKTVVVLPEPESLIPFVSEVASLVDDFNVSMGYPVKRSSVFSLLEHIFKAQETRRDGEYYSKDYLRLLSHPLVKNIVFRDTSAVTRVLVHKLEELVRGAIDTELGGSLFLGLKDIEDCDSLYLLAEDTIKKMGLEATKKDLLEILKQLHAQFFLSWEDVEHFKLFSEKLNGLLDTLVKGSPIEKYPMNLKIIDKMFSILEEFMNSSFKDTSFSQRDIFKIFMNKLESEAVSFKGTPLKGLQILGLFETRSLNFDNVVIIDTNESVLPKLKIYEPLIPRDVMMSLGLNRLEKEEEIQRYQFMRLISSAKNVHLIYEKSKDKEKSRFIEELIWDKQKAQNNLGSFSTPFSRFRVKVTQKETGIEKSPKHISFLKGFQYSASSINTYLNCPLRFYFQYVLGLSEKEDMLDEPESRDIGNFIHGLLEETYRGFLAREVRIDKAFRKYFFSVFEESFESKLLKKMKSDAFLLKEILQFRLEGFLNSEEVRELREVVCVEEAFLEEIKLGGGSFKFKCKVDRIDKLADNSLLVIDYKTGSSDIMPSSVAKIEAAGCDRQLLKESVKSFQLPLYMYCAGKKFNGCDINAALYNIKDTGSSGDALKRLFKKDISSHSKNEAMSIFFKALEYVVYEILNPEIPFTCDAGNLYYCKTCPFFYMCR